VTVRVADVVLHDAGQQRAQLRLALELEAGAILEEVDQGFLHEVDALGPLA
jgi:hypothetical protein